MIKSEDLLTIQESPEKIRKLDKFPEKNNHIIYEKETIHSVKKSKDLMKIWKTEKFREIKCIIFEKQNIHSVKTI